MLRLLVEDRGTNDESARIARLGDYLETEGFKHIIEVNADIWGTGETFQEARAELKERLREHIEELQIFYENIESEDPIIVDAENNVVKDYRGLIWFDEEPKTSDDHKCETVRFIIRDENENLLSEIAISPNSTMLDDMMESDVKVSFPLVQFGGRFMNVSDLPNVQGVEISTLILEAGKMLGQTITNEEFVAITVSTDGMSEIKVGFTIQNNSVKPQVIKLTDYRFATLDHNGRYVYIDQSELDYPRDFDRYWEIIVDDRVYYVISRNMISAWEDANFYVNYDLLDQKSTINIREINAHEFKAHFDEHLMILEKMMRNGGFAKYE